MRAIERTVGGRTVTVYGSGTEGAPTVYLNSYREAGDRIMGICRSSGCGGFNLVSVSGLDWNGDLSPWPADRVLPVGGEFTGNAGEYADFLIGDVIPYAEGVLGESDRIVAGYSLGGLFALFAPHVTDAFGTCVSVSGSLWYPGFAEFVERMTFRRVPEHVYLSLGDSEARTRNRVLCTVEDRTRRIHDAYVSAGIDSILETNPGNHSDDADGRLARGVAWAVHALSGASEDESGMYHESDSRP